MVTLSGGKTVYNILTSSLNVLASLKWAYVSVCTIIGLSILEFENNVPNSWQVTMNSALLVGAVSLLGFSLWTNRKIEKRQDLLEAALFGGASNGARKLLEGIDGMGKLQARMETTIWGEHGQGGLVQEIASLRQTGHEHSNHLNLLLHSVEKLEEWKEKQTG